MLKKIVKISPLFFIIKSQAFCFDAAGSYYNVNPKLLKSIAIIESSLRPKVINTNKNKFGVIVSTDYGLMQINSSWFKKLSDFQVNGKNLINDTCFNVHIGAWVLSQNFSTHGYNWNSVGAYNAGFEKSKQHLRDIYIEKVKVEFRKLQGN